MVVALDVPGPAVESVMFAQSTAFRTGLPPNVASIAASIVIS